MTIVAGFKCNNGLVLASDTLYSAVNNTYGDKLWVLQSQEPAVVFGGAGTVGPLTRARDEIERRLKQGLSFQTTLERVDEALAKVSEKFPPRDGSPQVRALVAIRAEGRTRLYENVFGEVALSPVDHPYACLGVDTLGNYFAEMLFREGTTMWWAEVVSTYLVAQCKKYASGYCGGDTHIVIVPSDESVVPFKKTQQEYIQEQELYLSKIGDALQLVLPDEHTIGEAVALQRARIIADAIDEARAILHQTITTAPAYFSGRNKEGRTISQHIEHLRRTASKPDQSDDVSDIPDATRKP
jgi:hypothetical protein